jgi:hypothetical protein
MMSDYRNGDVGGAVGEAERLRQAFSDGFYSCASHYVDDPDSKQFGEMAAEAWGDYAVSQLGICGTPPVGWFCTRKPGHSGPCAAVETRP